MNCVGILTFHNLSLKKLQIQNVFLVVAEMATGNPLFKASEEGDFDVLWEREDITRSEVQVVPGEHVMIGLKVRLEAFPTGLPMSLKYLFCPIEVYFCL
jgi:hypothetical protein